MPAKEQQPQTDALAAAEQPRRRKAASAPAAGRGTVTMQNIAELLGVSKATVSLALSGSGRISPEMRQTVFQTAADMGFEPNPHARRLSRGRSDNLIGVFSLDLDLGTQTLKLSYIQQLLMARGFQVSLHASGVLPLRGQAAADGGMDGGVVIEAVGANDLLAQLCRLTPRALVCNTSDFHPATLQALHDYQREGGVVVCYDHPVAVECDQVVFDRAGNAAEAARHLLAAGHRRIGMHPGRQRPRDRRFTSPRLEGFRDALGGQGVAWHEPWVFYSDHSYEEAGMEVAAQFLALPTADRPTALYIVNDRTASAFVNALARAGVAVPGDVSVVSEDDLPTARACIVPLTAVTHPAERIAEAVVELLDRRLQGGSHPPQTVTVGGELVARESVQTLTV